MPTFLGAPVEFDIRSNASAQPPRGGATPLPPRPFTIQQQGLLNWCWAAISSSVANCYNSSNSWTQCRIASSCLSAACCNNPAPDPPCNDTYYLDKALSLVGHLATGPGPIMRSGTAQTAEIQTEVNNSRPICAYIDWGAATDGHFVALSGYDPTTVEVRVEDPDGATQTWMNLSKFSNAYPGGGTWTYTYWTS
jgi:hypothetical protein